MFEPTGLGLDIFNERYAMYEGETWDEACRRVAKWAASCEDRDKIGEVEENFYRIIREGLFMPGGRIMYAAGRPFAQGLNCFVLPVHDSREGIGKLFNDTMVVSGTGGGIGVNFSNLRGRGATIHGMGGSSTGAVSFMKAQNSIGDQIIAGGSRRTALMQCLNVDHPDIEEFIKTKLDRGPKPKLRDILKRMDEYDDLNPTLEAEMLEAIESIDYDGPLTNANVSVVIPSHLSDVGFVENVRKYDNLPLTFNGKETGGYVNAGTLWESIVHNAWESGEPGVLNANLANRTNSIAYKHELISTNPCGEIWLPGYGCCDLGALVLPRFVDSYNKFDYDKFYDAILWSVRFLDNVLTVTQYPLPEIKEMAQGERRIGLGVMGLHSMLLDMNCVYSHADDEIAQVFGYLKDTASYVSMLLAQEKGPFPFYDPHKHPSGNVYGPIGIRNCALLTVAPTGTTAMVQGVTTGIEPMFSPLYIRRRFVDGEKVGSKYTEETLVISKDFTDHMGIAEGAYDVTPEGHFKVQAIVQGYVDNAVSKTINLPKAFDEHSLSDLWLEYLPQVKGSTFYREGSRANEPYEYVPTHDALEVLQNWKGNVENEDGTTSIDSCINGLCEI